MNEFPRDLSHHESSRPAAFESALGSNIVKGERQELGEYKVGDIVNFKRGTLCLSGRQIFWT